MAKRLPLSAVVDYNAELQDRLADRVDELAEQMDGRDDNSRIQHARVDRLAADVSALTKRSVLYEPHTDTVVDVAVLRDRVAEIWTTHFEDRLALSKLADAVSRIERDIKAARAAFLLDIAEDRERRALADRKYSTFGARLRWLLTGK
jgi:hypothetical protein